MSDKPLWIPSPERVAASNVTRLIADIRARWDVDLPGFDALWQWSVDEQEKFWDTAWDFLGIVGQKTGPVLIDGEKMPGARFFPEARLNWAENLLRRRDDSVAIHFRAEDKVRRSVTWQDLYASVSRFSQALRAAGVQKGDRVAAYMPNMPETIVAMLGATAIGATFSSCSPDFGIRGVVDRFGQIEPKVLITANGYFYAGKSHSSLDKLPAILAEMPTVETVVVVPFTEEDPDIADVRGGILFGDFVGPHPAGEIVFEPVEFHHPLYIMYSSGTTGVPKCIVHSTGGALLMHKKEHQLMADLKPGDVLFYFTTCGWMMWNWLTSALGSEVTLALYDGSPFHPDGNVLWDYAEEARFSVFGTSAKYIDACNKAGLAPAESHDLSSVRTIASTGSPLVPESFDYVYEKVKSDLHLASVSGGTDLLACLVGADPTSPVYKGEIQKRCLGLAVDVFDEDGRPVRGDKGDLVCTKPFPSMPIGFWNDPDGSRYFDAYYAKYPNVWAHGDWVELTEHGGMIIYGRSDATLNPGGVRIGTAEIYRQVESLDEILEGLVIGQDWDGDTRVVLFVKLRDGVVLDDALTAKIKKQIRDNATPRHVPAKVLAVDDIPRTKSGKIVELAVRHVVHGRAVKNKEALANPEALAFFANREELAS